MNEKIFAKAFVITFIIILAWAVICTGILIYSSARSNELGRLNGELREQLTVAVTENRRLGETIDRCRDITGELKQSTDKQLTDTRAAVELIEELRAEVYSLESELGSDWQSSYYSDWDSYLGL